MAQWDTSSSSDHAKYKGNGAKRQKIDIPDAHLTVEERNNILAAADKATRAAIRSRRLSLTNLTRLPSTHGAYKSGGGANMNGGGAASSKSGSAPGASRAFLITALEELRRLEDEDLNRQDVTSLEREVEHLRRGLRHRDEIIGKLREELEEKDRILQSLPRELVVNWVVTQRMMTREPASLDVPNSM